MPGRRTRATLLLPLLGWCGCHLLYPFNAEAPPSQDTAVPPAELGTDASTHDATADGGGWRQVGKLDPAKDGCPKPWTFFSTPQGCGINQPICADNSAPVIFDPGGTYQEVRGFVRGIQYKSTDAFASPGVNQSIDKAYVDGVSISVGSPRRHVWTFAASLFAAQKSANSCPCLSGAPPPTFVGQAWTCDSGNFDKNYSSTWYTTQPLWDADSEGPGCVFPSQPGWFEVRLPAPTTESVEVRILLDGCDENVAITALELHVR
jgi:hypothetical protein